MTGVDRVELCFHNTSRGGDVDSIQGPHCLGSMGAAWTDVCQPLREWVHVCQGEIQIISDNVLLENIVGVHEMESIKGEKP